jgi:hypothetical protein
MSPRGGVNRQFNFFMIGLTNAEIKLRFNLPSIQNLNKLG